MKNKSFTLIELLVVIVIIGILAGVIIVSTSSSISKANFAKAQAFSNTVQQELLLNLVSEWTFDEGNAEDSWGNNDGTVTGATYQNKASGNCVYGGCYFFNGTNNYITMGPNNNLNFRTGDLTYSLWFKNYSIDANGHIIIRSAYVANESAIGIYIKNKIYNVVRNSSNSEVAVAANVVSNSWYFVTLTRKNGTIYAYLNGGSIGSTTGSSFNCINNTFTRVGANSTTNPDLFFNGLIDDVRIYNAALSTSQIKQEYVAGLNSLLANNNISKEEYDQRINSLALNND